MAYEEALRSITLPASGDLSASQYRFAVINSSGQVAVATAGAKSDGILQDDANAAGEASQLAIDGVSKVTAGEAIAAGADVAVGASGKAAVPGTGDVIVARAISAATADGDVISVLIARNYPSL